MLRLCLPVIFAAALAAQDFAAAGAYYHVSDSPRFTGWAMYAKPVMGDRVYAVGMIEAMPVKTEQNALELEARYQAGTAIRVARIQRLDVYALAEAGAATTRDYTAFSGSAGACIVTKIRGPWRIFVPVKYSNTTLSRYRVSVGVGIGAELK